MAKALAVSTQLKNANARIVELEKQLASAKSTNEYTSKNASEATAMLEQVHQVLDALPNPVQRESEGENSWDRVKRSPVTRLAAWLAIRQN